MVYFDYYLIGINIIGFLLFMINTWLYSHTKSGQVDAFLTIISFMGGSAGIVLSMLLFDRKAVKGNMMSRVFVACMLVIQIVIVLIIHGFIKNDITVAFWDFFNEHKILILYLIAINTLTIIAFAIDKINAISHKSRIRIVTLLALAFFGGSIGALIAMYSFKHKIHKDYFTIGVPIILLMQIVVLFFVMNMNLKFW